jgi:hypothetical protein
VPGPERDCSDRASGFFRLALSHETLANYYKTTHILKSKHGYSLTEAEEMLPWERDIYVGFIIQDIDKKLKQQQHQD